MIFSTTVTDIPSKYFYKMDHKKFLNVISSSIVYTEGQAHSGFHTVPLLLTDKKDIPHKPIRTVNKTKAN